MKLLGHRNDVCELYKAADVFVFPSFQEGLPVSVMEAMAMGKPCVVSNIRGNTDLIKDNIKKNLMKLVFNFTSKTSTSTLSNVGIIDIENKYK